MSIAPSADKILSPLILYSSKVNLKPLIKFKAVPTQPLRKILVTGGAGFIGAHLVDRLLKMGNTVVVYDNFNSFYKGKESKIATMSTMQVTQLSN